MNHMNLGDTKRAHRTITKAPEMPARLGSYIALVSVCR